VSGRTCWRRLLWRPPTWSGSAAAFGANPPDLGWGLAAAPTFADHGRLLTRVFLGAAAPDMLCSGPRKMASPAERNVADVRADELPSIRRPG